MNFQIHKNDIEKVIGAVPGSIEKVLYYIYSKVQNYQPQQSKLKDESIMKEKNMKMMSETMDYAR